MQNNRKLSKPRGSSSAYSFRHHSSFSRGGLLFAFIILFYLYYRISNSMLDATDYTNNNRDIQDFQSLDAFPEYNMPKKKSTIKEWERQIEYPLIGLYRYSPVAAIQLPIVDLEEMGKEERNLEKVSLQQDINLSNSNDIVVLTRKGFKYNPEDGKRTPNQDRVVVMSKRFNKIRENRDKKIEWWIGLFDGHGFFGHDISQHVSLYFAQHINELWEDDLSPKPERSLSMEDGVNGIFQVINSSLRYFPNAMRSAGCTGISVLKRDNSLYFSNLGDSVGFVVSYDKRQDAIQIIYTTKPHKPDSPGERKRIEEKGGRVIDPPLPQYSARLAIPTENGEMGLAMSRSFGDLDGEKFGLSAEPDTDILDLSQYDKKKEYFVVVATDGLIDSGKLSEHEVGLAMAKAMSDQKDQSNVRRRSDAAQGIEAAKKLILKASKLWFEEPGGHYRDDISIVVHKIRL